MEAYNSNNAVIDKKIIYKAASNALGDDFLPPIWWQHKTLQTVLVTSMLFIVLIIGFWLGQKEPLLVLSSELPNKIAEQDVTVAAKPKKIQQVQQEKLKKTSEEKLIPLNSTHKVISPSKAVVAPITEVIVEKEREQKVVSADLNKIDTHTDDNYQIEAVEGVSDDLLARFQAAMDETKDKSLSPQQDDAMNGVDGEIKALTQMPAWVQNGVPKLRFEQHIYASNGEGWVNVNGRDRYQGDMITPELQLSKILPQQIILTYRGEKFSLPALTNW
jgi:general secretion pathway protein A